MAYENTKLTLDEESTLHKLTAFHLMFNTLYLGVVFAYISTIYKRAMHLNIKVLLIHLPIPYALNCVAHFYICSCYFLYWPVPEISHISVIISDSAAFGNFFNSNVLIAERIFATWKVSKYEKINQRYPTFSVSLIIIQWIVSCLTFYVAHIPGFFKFIVCIVALFNTAVVITVLIFLPLVTKRIYRRFLSTFDGPSSFSSIWSVTLSQRYQSSENLRLTVMVNNLLIIELISSIVELLLHMAVRLHTPFSLIWFEFLTSLYWSIGVESILLMIVVTYFTRPRTQTRQTAVGQQLTTEDINRLYFETYQKAWS